jgi:hypothetical protein
LLDIFERTARPPVLPDHLSAHQEAALIRVLERASWLARLIEIPPHGENFGWAWRASRNDETDESGFEVKRRPLDTKSWQIAELMKSSRGFSILKLGATGRPRGRPWRGVRSKELIGALIEARLGDRSLEELLGSIRRGRPSPERAAVRADLAVIVWDILQPQNQVNAPALADFLGVSRSTLWGLARDGKEKNERKSPKGGEEFSRAA